MTSSWPAYEAKKETLATTLKSAQGEVALGKTTSNLFRLRQKTTASRLDVRGFHGVIALDEAGQTADVEGMTRYDELVKFTLRHSLMPAVVPQLKSITVGGAIAGLGIEASSFRYGLVHETVLELEVLLADGSTVVARPDNEHKELFFGFPNSYGTLGYVLRAKLKLVKVKPFVAVQHIRIDDTQDYFSTIRQIVKTGRYGENQIDFMDGVVFGPREQYLTLGQFVDHAPRASDYTYLQLYYRSIRQRKRDYLTIQDYLWRWDSDWFWCSKNFPGAQNRLVRLLFGKLYLHSTFYWKLMALDQRYNLMTHLDRLLGRHTAPTETIIQDVEIPLPNCADFLEFFQKQIGIEPIWVCPLKTYDDATVYPLYALDLHQPYVNFGFWDSIPTTEPAGHYNRLIEDRVEELNGRKSLYSDSFYTRQKFWQLYNQPAYQKLKQRYDPTSRLKDLYDKCVKNG